MVTKIETPCAIREATKADVPALASLAAEFADYPRSLGDPTEFRLDAFALERDGFGDEPAFGGLVAEQDGVIVGYLLHHRGYDTDAACRLLVVADLFVTERARGQGIGAILMNAAIAVARAQGAAQLVWTVYRRNLSARGFYERIGGRYVKDLELMYLQVQ